MCTAPTAWSAEYHASVDTMRAGGDWHLAGPKNFPRGGQEGLGIFHEALETCFLTPKPQRSKDHKVVDFGELHVLLLFYAHE